MLESSIIAQSNQRLGMYLNVPIQCGSIYDEFIAQLQACKTGANLGNENISHGCLVQVSTKKLIFKYKSDLKLFQNACYLGARKLVAQGVQMLTNFLENWFSVDIFLF